MDSADGLKLWRLAATSPAAGADTCLFLELVGGTIVHKRLSATTKCLSGQVVVPNNLELDKTFYVILRIWSL
jgi:hypothetical protein